MVEKEKHQDENGKVNVRFSNCMLKQIKTISNYGDDVINVYITFRFRTRNEIPDFGIGNCLFGALKIQKRAVSESHYKYSRYGVCYDFAGEFSFSYNNKAIPLIIFGVASSTHDTNKANNIYMLGKDFTQSQNATAIYADRVYKTDPSMFEKLYVMSIHYNGDESILVILVKIFQ